MTEAERKVKALRTRHKPLSQVQTYQHVVGNLLSHIRTFNKMEERQLKNIVVTAETIIYKQLRADLLRLDPGKDAPQIDKERHCDSVCALRDSRKTMRRKITKTRLYSPTDYRLEAPHE